MGKILIACEESQEVTKRFRSKGHEAYSCDIIPCSGGYDEWHIQEDVTKVLEEKWDMIIAFPPCTYLTVTGNRWFNIDKYGDKAIKRIEDRENAIKFFLMFFENSCKYVAVENPVGIMSTRFRKPDQIIHPYHFGDPYEKRTCLWLKSLPKLYHTNVVEPLGRKKFKSGRTMDSWFASTWNLPKDDRARVRSKTFPGIAQAIVDQWSHLVDY